MSCHAVTDSVSVILLLVTWWSFCNAAIANLPCGFPGKPTNEKSISEEKILYSDGETVEYSCQTRYSFFTNGNTSRTCKNGSWSNTMPFCNPNIAFGKEVKIFQNHTLLNIPNLGYVVDHRATCLNLPPLGKNMKWLLQISLGEVYGVRSLDVYTRNDGALDLKVYVKDTATNKTEICGSLTEIVSDSLSTLYCRKASDTRGFPGGIPGDTIIIEDVSSNDLPFEICDVHVYAYYGNTDCGKPEAPAFGSAKYISKNIVQYDCQPGYNLMGPHYRTCDSDGVDFTYWPKANMPICKPYVASNCSSPIVPNGRVSYDIARTAAVIDCDKGFDLVAAKVLLCVQPGIWLDYAKDGQHCKRKIACSEPPPVPHAEVVKTQVNSQILQAIYACKSVTSPSKIGLSYCLENGTWSKLPESFRCDTLDTTYQTTEMLKKTSTFSPQLTTVSANTTTVSSSGNDNDNKADYEQWNGTFLAIHDFWAIALICAATLAVIFVAVSVFLARKLKANGTKLESVERSSKTIKVQYEGRNDNVSFNPPCPRMESPTGRNNPVYEEIYVYDDIGSQEVSRNQKTKERRGTDAIHKNIVQNACYENPKECELSCEYENLHVNVQPVYQNCSRPLESIYENT